LGDVLDGCAEHLGHVSGIRRKEGWVKLLSWRPRRQPLKEAKCEA
jgi:hypothetical protein